MASRPSGLRQPSSVKSSNSNLASESGAGDASSAAKSANPLSRLPSSNSMRKKITTPGLINPPGSRDSGLATDIDHFLIGDTVYINGDPSKRGKICFIGDVDFAQGDFAGIALDLPIGNHDGVVKGKRYFECAPSHGLLTKLSRLTRDPVLDSPSTPRAPQSCASSVINTPDPPRSIAGSIKDTRSPSPSLSQLRTPKVLGTPNAAAALPINSSLAIGERVIVASATGGTKIGILKYIGPTEFAAGNWAGVELLTPMGKNNGSVGGKSYFKCPEKHGLFVPASKVISSPVNKTPRRHGSRESLFSNVSSIASSATPGIRRSSSVRQSTQCLPTCSLQAVLTEKEKHMERLIKERELDRVELANLNREFEDRALKIKKLEAEYAEYQQKMAAALQDSDMVYRLKNCLDEEKRKLEDLQYTLDEERIMRTDLQAQLDNVTAKSSEQSKASVVQESEKLEYEKKLEDIEAKLAEQIAKGKEAGAKLTDAQAEIQSLTMKIDDLTKNNETVTNQSAEVKAQKEKLVAVHQAEIAAMKKTEKDQKDAIEKLNQQLTEKRQREEELREKLNKVQAEYKTTHQQKCKLENEIVDLVHTKTDASELYSGKIEALSNEVQELREKLQSAEEDKAVLRRINAEFKNRIPKLEESEAAMKKSLEEMVTKAGEEKEAIINENAEKVKQLETEKIELQAEIKKQTENIAELQKKISDTENSAQLASKSGEEHLEAIKSLTAKNSSLVEQLKSCQERLNDMEKEKEQLQSSVIAQKKELAESELKSKKLSEELQALTDQLSSKAKEVTSLAESMEALKLEKSKSEASTEEKVVKVASLEEKISILSTNLNESQDKISELEAYIDTMKKDRSKLKEQLSSYKADASRFEEIEKGLSQELLSVRGKLEQKNKALLDLEKELAEKKAEIDTSKASKLDAGKPEAHIDFLNSIIVDLQKKNEDLKVRLNVFVNGGAEDPNSNKPEARSATHTLQSLRLYCDICEKFDLHDTEECPAQESEDNTRYGSLRGESRPYCETCEMFGHVTGECDDQETF